MGNCCTSRDQDLPTENGKDSYMGDPRRSHKNQVKKSLTYIASFFEESKLHCLTLYYR